MKKIMAVILSVLFLFLFGCTGNKQTPVNDDPAENAATEESGFAGKASITESSDTSEETDSSGNTDDSEETVDPEKTDDTEENDIPKEDDTPAEEADPAEIGETAAENDSQNADTPAEMPAGRLVRGYYMELCFSVPDGWGVLDRSEIAARLGLNEEYVKADPSQILHNYYPYYELWAEDGDLSSIQFIIENYPVTCMDGSTVNTAEEYMDHNADYLPEHYRNMGIQVSEEDRSVIELAGRSYERFSFSAETGVISVTQTMLSRKNGAVICTIYITSTDETQEQQLLSRLSAE